jgi:hypothetical protein
LSATLDFSDKPGRLPPRVGTKGAATAFAKQCPLVAFSRRVLTGGRVMGNPFVHVELMSTDVGKAKSFYGKLFDWKLEDMPTGEIDSEGSFPRAAGGSPRFTPNWFKFAACRH